MSGSRGKRNLRRALLAAIAALYVAAIPWYRRSDAEAGTWFGLPDWVAVAVVCYVLAAVLNSLAWMLTEVSDGGDRDEDPSE